MKEYKISLAFFISIRLLITLLPLRGRICLPLDPKLQNTLLTSPLLCLLCSHFSLAPNNCYGNLFLSLKFMQCKADSFSLSWQLTNLLNCWHKVILLNCSLQVHTTNLHWQQDCKILQSLAGQGVQPALPKPLIWTFLLGQLFHRTSLLPASTCLPSLSRLMRSFGSTSVLHGIDGN